MNLDGASALVTGGASGLGLGTARRLASDGAHVVICDLPEPAVQRLAASIPHPSRPGDPAEYADCVAFIIRNGMINGETIRLDGAVRMEYR